MCVVCLCACVCVFVRVCVFVWLTSLLSGAASLLSAYCLILVTGVDAHSCDPCIQNMLWRQRSPLQTIKCFCQSG